MAFLTARWEHLAMLQWEVDPAWLEPFVPPGTELDPYEGRHYVSLVGFLFRETRLLGLPIPGHQNFEEVNLRFYVRRKHGDEIRRGVVFLREVVPLWAVTTIANYFYGENYVTLPMGHAFDDVIQAGWAGLNIEPKRIHYEWQASEGVCSLDVAEMTDPYAAPPGSLEEYITEHYWGYTRISDRTAREYRVDHPCWRLRSAQLAKAEVPAESLYGRAFVGLLREPPVNAFVCDGSEISVEFGASVG
jgi:uncharacterized protein YqjF (DUF2071 family)